MNIEKAVETLQQHLGEPDVFVVRHNGKEIVVDVNFIYRIEDVQALNGQWEGFRVCIGRRSCW